MFIFLSPMKKLLLLLLLIPCFATAQQTVWTTGIPPLTVSPTGGSLVPTWRTLFGTDSLTKSLFVGFNSTNFYQIYTAAQQNARFQPIIPLGTALQYFRGDLSLATFPTGLPPTGSAGGDLSGTYPNPTVNTINSVTKSYYDPTSSIQTQINGKQATGNYITALTGDGTASGPGSVPFTLATVNSNTGAWGSASSVPTFTVNGKGLITAASNTSIQIAESQVTNLVSDLAAKQAAINGTGFVKATGTTISYDNSTYLTTAAAASTYQTLANLETTLTNSSTLYPSGSAVTTAIATAGGAFLPLAGGTMTGNIIFTGSLGLAFPNGSLNDDHYTISGWNILGGSSLVTQTFSPTTGDSHQYLQQFNRTNHQWSWSKVGVSTHLADIDTTGVLSLGNPVEVNTNKTATQSSSAVTYPNWLGITNYVTGAYLPLAQTKYSIPYTAFSGTLTTDTSKIMIDAVNRKMAIFSHFGRKFNGLVKIGKGDDLGGYNQFSVEDTVYLVDNVLNGYNGINNLAKFKLMANSTHRIRGGNETVTIDLNGFHSDLISSGEVGYELVSRLNGGTGHMAVMTGGYNRVLIDVTGDTVYSANASMAHAPGNVAGSVMLFATGYHATDQNTGPVSASVKSSANITSGGDNTTNSGQAPPGIGTGNFWNQYNWSTLPNISSGRWGFGLDSTSTTNVKAWVHVKGGNTTVPSIILNPGTALTTGIDGAFIYDGTNPIFYVGTTKNTIATDINTMTFTNKTWNGSVISGTYGGTGVNNGVKTITLAQNLNLAGGFNMTLNTTGSTNITLPTSGTLSTLAGTENLTNKTVNKVTLTAPATAATITITNNKTLAVTNTLTFSGTDATVLTGPNTSGSLVVGGTITWPGTLYTTPTTGTVSAAGILNLSPALATQTANMVLAGPTTGSAATPTFRALVAADLPSSVSLIQGTADLTAQTTAGNITTFTVGAATATFNIAAYLNVTAVVTDVIQIQVTYTDENNTAQTVSFSTLSTVTNSTYSPVTIRAKNGTVITVKSNLTTGIGSITFDAGGRISQL